MSPIPLDLTAPWNHIIPLLEAPVFLEASAGSGKTFTLERLVLMAVLQGIALDSILGVTFTEKSALDLRTKVRKTLREARKVASEGRPNWPAQIGFHPQAPLDPFLSSRRLKEALDNFGRSRFLTIHGFCQSILTAYPFEAGLPFRTRLEGREWEFQAALDYLRPLLPSPGNPGLSPSFWRALGQSMEEAAKLLLSMKSAGWFRPQGMASATPVPGKEELQALWRDFLQLEKELEKGSSGLRCALSAMGPLEIPPLDLWSLEENTGFISRMDSMPARLQALQTFCNLGSTPPEHPLSPLDLDVDLLKKLEEWGSSQKMIKKDWTGPNPKKSFPDTPAAQFYLRIRPLVDNFLNQMAPYRDSILGESSDLEALCRLKFLQDHGENFSRQLDEKAATEGVLTFDAMISLVYGALHAKGSDNSLVKALQKKFRVLMIDEFQDTDQLQWGIFRRLFLTKNHSLITVGDPKQGIYGFRGADLQVYLDSRREIVTPETGGQALNLPKNFRSGKLLVEGVNLLSARLFFDDPQQTQGVSFHPAQAAAKEGLWVEDGLPGVELVQLPPEASRSPVRRRILFQDCAERLGSLHGVPWRPERDKSRTIPLGWNDMAVLVQTAREGQQVLKALESRGIPATLFGRNPLFATSEALDLALFFQVMQDPLQVKSLMALGICPLMELPLWELSTAREDGRLTGWMDFLTSIRELALKGKYLKAFRRLFSTTEPQRWFPCWLPLEERLLRLPGGERIYANIRHMLEILQEASQNLPLALDAVPQYLSSRARKDPSEEETNLRLDRDEEAVKILTLHGSKGLEFPVVYLAGGYSSKPPETPGPSLKEEGDRQVKIVRFLKNGETPATNPEKDFVEAERRRLTYVALTRAKARVILALPPEKLDGKTKKYLSDWWVRWTAADFMDNELFHIRPALIGQEPPPALPQRTELISPDILSIPPGLPLENLSRRLFSWASYTGLVRDSTPSSGSQTLPPIQIQAMPENIIPMDWMEELGGKGFGTFYHEILEKVDFSSTPEIQELEVIASAHLPPREYERRRSWLPGFLGHRRAFLDHVWTLGGTPFQFSSLESSRQWKEVDFFMTAGGISGDFLGKNIQVPQGLLQGAIDLIFLHQGQYWVLDWKTTRVEESLLTPEGLAQSMVEDGYLVQMGIYWTALRRMLAAWDGHHPLGGVLYAYLRHNTLVQITPSSEDSSRWESFLSGAPL